jgi:hypothetical protein
MGSFPAGCGGDCWVVGVLVTASSATWPSQQGSTVVLEKDPDGNQLWQVSMLAAGGPGSQDLVDLGSFPSLVTAQAAAEHRLSRL